MRYSQTVRLTLGQDVKKVQATTYAAENAVITFGDEGQTITWSEIKDAVDFVKFGLEGLSLNSGIFTFATDVSSLVNTKKSSTNSYVLNGLPGMFLSSGLNSFGINNGSAMNLTGTDAEITFNKEVDASGNILSNTDYAVTLNDESLKYIDNIDETQTVLQAGDIRLEDNSNASGNTVSIMFEPAKISFQKPSVNIGTFTDVTVDGINCVQVEINLNIDPLAVHESGPELKLAFKIDKGLSTDDTVNTPFEFELSEPEPEPEPDPSDNVIMSANILINLGEWLNLSENTSNFRLIRDIEKNNCTDNLISSNNIKEENVFYKRNNDTVTIAWQPGTYSTRASNSFDYKVIQVA